MWADLGQRDKRLKFDPFSDGIVPTPGPRAAVDWLARADHD